METGTNGANDSANGLTDNNAAIPVRNNASDDGAIDPSAAIAPKKRGRHPGDCECDRCLARKSGGNATTGNSTGNPGRKTASSKTLDLDALTQQLIGAHKLFALVSKSEVFNISEDEAKKLAQALRNVSQHYNINISPKAMAWTQLVTIAAAIYGPRIGVLMLQYKIKKAEAEKAKALNIQTSNAPKANPSNGQFVYQ